MLRAFCLSALSAASLHAADDPAVVGRWNPSIKTEVLPIHVILLPTGKILYWDRHDQGTHDNIPRIWDPASSTTQKAPAPSYDLFCSGHSVLANGDVLIAGGHIVDGEGEDKLSIYNYRTNTWDAALGRMNDGRWYPTNTTLPNGDVLITSGSTDLETNGNEIPQVYQARTRTLRTLDSARLEVGLYPQMSVQSQDRVFMAGPDSITRFLDVRGHGKWITVGMTASGTFRHYGSSVKFAPGKVMICGGGIYPPTASSETIDLNEAVPKWKLSDPMHYARRHHTAVMLPDGKVLVTGGTSGTGFNNQTGAVFMAETWDPETGHWTNLSPSKTIRLYHSFSLLLPDGRILTGGGGHPGAENHFDEAYPDFEIYEPPYLFKGSRPVIDAVPDTLYYGKTVRLSTRSPGTLRVSLLRTAAVTHAFDHNADFNWLPVRRDNATDLTVSAPLDSVITPPGPHLLFLLDSAGAPSIAKMVWVLSSGGSGILAEAAPERFRIARSGNRLRIAGPAELLSASAPVSAYLLDARGERVADLKRISAREFRLPADMPAGAYAAVVNLGGRTRTATVLLP